MRNRVDHSIDAVNISANPYRFLFNAGINFRDCLDLRVHSLCGLINLMQKVRERLKSKRYPLAESRIRKIPQLHIVFRVQSTLLLERRDRVVVKTGPRLFPTFEMRHPVRNIDIDPINPSLRDLPHTLHVDLAPLACVWADPDILIAFPDPECRAASENCRLPSDLSLQPVRMV